MSSGVYKITNSVNGSIYIGSAINIDKRKRFHLWCLKNNKHCNTHLQRSFIKYGDSFFKHEVIEYCLPEDCINREQYFIDKYILDGYNLYNMCKIAASVLGIKRSEETKIKLSIAAKKRPKITEETRKKLQEVHSKYRPSSDTIKKIALANTGKKRTDESKKRIGDGNRGKVRTPEMLIKMRNVRIGVSYHTDESKRKISISGTGRKHTLEAKRKMSKNRTNKKMVDQFTLSGTYINTHSSLTAAAKHVGVSYTLISRIVNGRQRVAKNFTFKYSNNVC